MRIWKEQKSVSSKVIIYGGHVTVRTTEIATAFLPIADDVRAVLVKVELNDQCNKKWNDTYPVKKLFTTFRFHIWFWT